MISPNVILPYDGTHASIPAGFIRYTALDGKFPKGVTSGFGDTGGATTHTHTSPAHSHTDSHTHSFTTSTPNNPNGGRSHETNDTGTIDPGNHTHPGTTGTVVNGSTNSVAATYAAVSNNPPYYEVVFIKSTGYSFLPANVLVMRNAARTGLTYHTASENKFLRGAGTGANAGGTGGSTTNVHELTHTHSATSHYHNNTTISSYTQNGQYGGGDNTDLSYWGHSHTVSFSSVTSTVTATAPSITTTETVEPLHCKIRHYKVDSIQMPQPGDIALTAESTPPVGWLSCDGNGGTPNMNGFYAKNVNTDFTNNSNNGFGGNTHTHAARGHTHTGSAHTAHGGTVSESTGTSDKVSNIDPKRASSYRPHYHTLSSVNSTASSYQSANTTANESNNEPEYVKVQYIQYAYNPIGGGIMLT